MTGLQENSNINIIGGKVKTRMKKDSVLLVLPTLYIIVFLIIPLISIFILGIKDENGFTLKYYYQIFTNKVYLKMLLLTIRTSFIVTLCTLVMAYPIAYVMTICSKRTRAIFNIFVMVPFWSSILVRTYSWIVLLQSKGVVNSMLMQLGIINEPIKLLYNPISVTIGMTNALLPYMILSLYSVLDGIDRNLILAAKSLGANKFTAFFKVYFPLSINGVANGCIMVFVMAMGYYITPALLGGEDTPMISQFISTQVSKLLNWQIGSAAAFVLLIITMILLNISNRVLSTKNS